MGNGFTGFNFVVEPESISQVSSSQISRWGTPSFVRRVLTRVGAPYVDAKASGLVRQGPTIVQSSIWRCLTRVPRLDRRCMSAQARDVEVIDIDDHDLPHDSTVLPDDSNTSIQLPDLAEILAGLNENVSKADYANYVTKDDARAFGNAIAHLQLRQSDGSVTKSVLSKPRSRPTKVSSSLAENKVLKEKKVRAPKVSKAPRQPKEKAPKRKPLTITERAVAPFLPQSDSTAVHTVGATSSILAYLTPTRLGSASKSDAIITKKPVARRRRTPKNEEVPPLSTPRTAQKRHNKQTLVYKDAADCAEGDSYLLNPSRLVSLSKGHWQVGNRDSNLELTDGGPQEIVSNQERFAYKEHEDQLLDLTMLPAKVPRQSMDPPEQRYSELPSNSVPSSDIDEDTDARDIHQYLHDLVNPEEDEPRKTETEFPTFTLHVPPNNRSDTNCSLRELLEAGSGSGTTTPESVCGSKRSKVATVTPIRNVSPKTCQHASPNSACIDLSVLESESTTGSKIQVADKVDQHSRNEESAPLAIEIETTDDEGTRPTSDSIVESRPDDVANVLQNRNTLPESVKPTTVPAVQERKRKVRVTKKRSTEDVCLVVPDSEDELPEPEDVVQSAVLPDPLRLQTRPPPPPPPNYKGYTTAQLQVLLSGMHAVHG